MQLNKFYPIFSDIFSPARVDIPIKLTKNRSFNIADDILVKALNTEKKFNFYFRIRMRQFVFPIVDNCQLHLFNEIK